MDLEVVAEGGSQVHGEMPDSLPPEIEEGNIEYKLKLVSPSASRFEHLVTQMKWRLQEGQGEAVYEIGVEDNGLMTGLSNPDMDASLKTLSNMAERLGADVSVLRQKHVDGEGTEPGRTVVEVLVRKVPDNQQFIDLRLAVLGNVDAGKSTLLGVLTQGEMDNGRGRARLNLFRHLHEIQTGRTSSISHEILGFNSKGEVVNYSESRTAEEICDNSTKLITLIDLCGHHKYLKTTIFGLTGHSPDFAVLVVSASTGLVGTTREHLGFALALGVPIFVVVTKTDICTTSRVKRTLAQLENLLKSPGCKKIPFRVESADDAVTIAAHFHNSSTCPIFAISCVNGTNIDLLTTFLNVLPPAHSSLEKAKTLQDHTEHQIDEVYTVPSVGLVVGGTVVRGSVREGDELLVGPGDEGQFVAVTIGSIHRNRLPVRVATSGQAACMSLGNVQDCTVRKGMVLLSRETMEPVACTEFQAKIYLLFHTKYISLGFQTVVHVGNVCQTAKIIQITDKQCVKTNEKALVVFRFISRPEFIREGTRLLFRDGQTKGMGEVTKIFPYESVAR